MLRPDIYKILRFVISGTTAAAVNIGVLFFLVHACSLQYLVASVISFLASVGVGFTLQKFWTFRDRSTTGTQGQLAGYTSITIMNLGLNTLLMYVLVSHLYIWYIGAQFISGLVIAVTSYIGNSLFVFKVRNTAPVMPSSQPIQDSFQ